MSDYDLLSPHSRIFKCNLNSTATKALMQRSKGERRGFSFLDQFSFQCALTHSISTSGGNESVLGACPPPPPPTH